MVRCNARFSDQQRCRFHLPLEVGLTKVESRLFIHSVGMSLTVSKESKLMDY
jgi:hypothetical protein